MLGGNDTAHGCHTSKSFVFDRRLLFSFDKKQQNLLELMFYFMWWKKTFFKKKFLETYKFFIQNFLSQSSLRFIEMMIIVSRFYFHQGKGILIKLSHGISNGQRIVASNTFFRQQIFFLLLSSFVFPFCMLTTLDFVPSECVLILKPIQLGCALLQKLCFFKDEL